MGVKRYFDGSRLIEVEVPDQPLPDVLNVRGRSALDVVAPSAANPSGVDPDQLLVDAASLPDLRPTEGTPATITKFPDPLPGKGEGAGVGQPSGDGLRDAWANNPARDPGTVETVQSGPIASALPPEQRAAAQRTLARHADANTRGLPSVDGFEQLANSWPNKAAVRDWIKANAPEGHEEPHAQATRDELVDEARAVYNAKDKALAASLV